MVENGNGGVTKNTGFLCVTLVQLGSRDVTNQVRPYDKSEDV